jgi:hypothetical protein
MDTILIRGVVEQAVGLAVTASDSELLLEVWCDAELAG